MKTVLYSTSNQFISTLRRVAETGEMIEVVGGSRQSIVNFAARNKISVRVATDYQRGSLIVHNCAHRSKMFGRANG